MDCHIDHCGKKYTETMRMFPQNCEKSSDFSRKTAKIYLLDKLFKCK